MSTEENWWQESLAAIPSPLDEPMTVQDIRTRFQEPKPPLDWLKRYLGELEEAQDVEMFALGSLTTRNAGRWLHYRWTQRFWKSMMFM